jgi:hypothetical protein
LKFYSWSWSNLKYHTTTSTSGNHFFWTCRCGPTSDCQIRMPLFYCLCKMQTGFQWKRVPNGLGICFSGFPFRDSLSVSLVFAAFLKLEAANSIRSSHVP